MNHPALRWVALLVVLAGLLWAGARHANHQNGPDRCARFNRDSTVLLNHLKDLAAQARATGLSTPELEQARRAYSLYYAQDLTGCASSIDKAKAQADLEGTP